MLYSKKIKVMHFVSGFKNGGVEQVVLNYTGLLNKNYNIQESIVYQHKANPEKLDLSKSLGNQMYQIPFKKTHPIKNLIATYKLIKQERPDIVHAHMNLVNFFPLIVAKMLKIPVRISHSHIAQNNINFKLASLFKKLNLLFATDLMACGEKAGKYMYGNHKFTILYNAIDQSKYKFNLNYRKEIRNKYNISGNTLLIGSIGRNVKQKNQKFLIDIFSKFLTKNPNAKLMLIGDGPLSSSLDNYISKKNCSKKIIRIKNVLSTEKYYSAFDAFLLPSLYEGLPVVAIEAQANGLLTLLSDSIDKTVSYNDGKTFFISINNGTEGWIKKLNHIRFNMTDRQKIYSKNYDIKYQYKFLFSYYKKLIMKSAR